MAPKRSKKASASQGDTDRAQTDSLSLDASQEESGLDLQRVANEHKRRVSFTSEFTPASLKSADRKYRMTDMNARSRNLDTSKSSAL